MMMMRLGCGAMAALAPSVCLAFQDPTWKPPLAPAPKFREPGERKSAEQLVKVSAVCEVEYVRPGDKFLLAFTFDIEPGWHIYWKNPGSSGGPTTIKLTAPHGFVIGKTLYPRPVAITTEEGVSYGYEGKTVLFVELTAPVELAASMAAFNADINFMVCKDVCLLGSDTKMITVPTVISGPPPSNKGQDSAIGQFKKRLPQPLRDVEGAQINFDGKTLAIEIPANGAATAEFFPVVTPGVTYGEATVTVEGGSLKLSVPVTVNPNDSLGKRMAVAGVVGLGRSPDEPCYEFEIPLPAT